MAASYKTQGQNAQRLLAMNETLREREDAARIDGENLRLAREEVLTLRRKVEQHGEQMAEKDRTFQVISLIPSPCHFNELAIGPERRVQSPQPRVWSSGRAKGQSEEG